MEYDVNVRVQGVPTGDEEMPALTVYTQGHLAVARTGCELEYVQYSFFDTDEIYSGKCDVEIYRVVINDKGAIDKTLLNKYTDDITIAL